MRAAAAAPTVCAVAREPLPSRERRPSTACAAADARQRPAAPRAARTSSISIDLSGYVFRAYHAIAAALELEGGADARRARHGQHAPEGRERAAPRDARGRDGLPRAELPQGDRRSLQGDAPGRARRSRRRRWRAARQIVARLQHPDLPGRTAIEADDLIAAVVERAVAEGVRVVIVSADKDLMQLVHDGDDRVLMWDSMRDRPTARPRSRRSSACRRASSAISSRSPGTRPTTSRACPSVGPKTAADLLKEYKTIDGIYANLGVDQAREAEGDAREARDRRAHLAGARDVEARRRRSHWDKERLRYGGANVEELRRLFIELEFTRLLDQMTAAQAAPRVRAARERRRQGRGARRRDGLRRGATGRSAAEAITRTYRHVLDAAGLDAVVAQAKKAGLVGVARRDDEPRPDARAASSASRSSAAPGEGVYVPDRASLPRRPDAAVVGEGPRSCSRRSSRTSSVRKVGYDLKRSENVLAPSRRRRSQGTISDPMLAAYLLDPEAPND